MKGVFVLANVLAVLLVPLSLQAAQPVHKCFIDGTVTYQNSACPSGGTGERPTVEQLNADRRKKQTQAAETAASAAATAPTPATAAVPAANERSPAGVARAVPPAASSRCDGRKTCSQMTSCAEAKYFLAHCPGVTMDGDGNGIPCERQWCSP